MNCRFAARDGDRLSLQSLLTGCCQESGKTYQLISKAAISSVGCLFSLSDLEGVNLFFCGVVRDAMMTWAVPGGLFSRESDSLQPPAIVTAVLGK